MQHVVVHATIPLKTLYLPPAYPSKYSDRTLLLRSIFILHIGLLLLRICIRNPVQE